MAVVLRRKLVVAFGVIAGGLVIGYAFVLPWYVRHRVGATLATYGASTAHIDVDLGVRGVEQITIRGAQLSADAMARDARSGPPGAVRFRSLRIADSTLAVGSERAALAGTIAKRTSTSVDFSIQLREPGAWTAEARGRVLWNDKRVELADTHVTVEVRRRGIANATIEDVSVTADIAGSLAPLDLRATGSGHVGRIAWYGEQLRDAQLPFSYSTREGLQLSGSAAFAGGRLVLDPVFVTSGKPTTFDVHVLGIDLARLASQRVTGTLDGHISLYGEPGAWSISDALLVARGKGRIAIDASSLSAVPHLGPTLADFSYDHLSARFDPTSAAVRLSLHGEGRTTHQKLELDVAVHGMRETRMLGETP